MSSIPVHADKVIFDDGIINILTDAEKVVASRQVTRSWLEQVTEPYKSSIPLEVMENTARDLGFVLQFPVDGYLLQDTISGVTISLHTLQEVNAFLAGFMTGFERKEITKI